DRHVIQPAYAGVTPSIAAGLRQRKADVCPSGAGAFRLGVLRDDAQLVATREMSRPAYPAEPAMRSGQRALGLRQRLVSQEGDDVRAADGVDVADEQRCPTGDQVKRERRIVLNDGAVGEYRGGADPACCDRAVDVVAVDVHRDPAVSLILAAAVLVQPLMVSP